MSALELIEGEALLDDEEGDESFDEETGEVTRKTNGVNGDVDDSSEEDDEDDDEEAQRAVSDIQRVFKYSLGPGLSLDLPRYEKVSSSTKMRSSKIATEDAKRRSGGGKSASGKTRVWMMKIWI